MSSSITQAQRAAINIQGSSQPTMILKWKAIKAISAAIRSSINSLELRLEIRNKPINPTPAIMSLKIVLHILKLFKKILKSLTWKLPEKYRERYFKIKTLWDRAKMMTRIKKKDFLSIINWMNSTATLMNK